MPNSDRGPAGDACLTDGAPYADAIVLAAGASERMAGSDKLMLQVAGLPLLAWTVRAAAAARCVRRVIVVARPDRVAALSRATYLREVDATVVPGGRRRQDSVAAGVRAADGEVVLIHDGARPLVTPDLVDRVAAAAREHGAAAPIVAVPESMRRLVDGKVVAVIDRHGLFRSQTPHGAQRQVLLDVYARQDPHGDHTFVDETTLMQSAGITVWTVPGEPANLKVTLPGDEQLAMALLQARILSGSVPARTPVGAGSTAQPDV
jgi:2-C-methyl-D-erythritol 4-phosphate cytidylyltransferase